MTKYIDNLSSPDAAVWRAALPKAGLTPIGGVNALRSKRAIVVGHSYAFRNDYNGSIGVGTGSIASDGTMTITTMTSGYYKVGQTVGGTNVPGNTTITAQLTGTPGGVGTYSTTAASTVASTTLSGGDVFDPINRTGNRSLCRGFMTWTRALSGNAFDYDGSGNYGKVGETSTQILARVPGIIAAELALPTPAGIAFLPLTYNDRGAANMTVAQSMANVAATVALFAAAGIAVGLLTDPPGGSPAFTGQRLTATQAANNATVRRLVIETYSGLQNTIVCDTWEGIADPNPAVPYDALDAVLDDGTHWNCNGAALTGAKLAPMVNVLLPRREFGIKTNSDVFSPNNPFGSLNVNPMVIAAASAAIPGTGNNNTVAAGAPGTGGSGTMANGYSGGQNGAETGLTRTYAINQPGPVSGQPMSVVTLGGTISVVNDASLWFQNITGLTPGSFVRIMADVEINGLAGFSSLSLRLLDGTSLLIIGGDFDYSGNAGIMPTGPYRLQMRSSPIRLLTAGARMVVAARTLAGAVAGGNVGLARFTTEPCVIDANGNPL